ncbi:MAG TPA: hypothetical protein VN207_00675 [Ktedonobacteraceae bacterium]|nr:hypothetical protein [Ktedonobacteraceae bacterium]
MIINAISKKKYPWLISLLATLGIIVLALATFLVYSRTSNNLFPDSLAGLAYGTAGLIFLVLATAGYTFSRRSRKRTVGALNASLHWHISFGIIALFLIFLHSFGHFEPVSGTYALFGLVALVISGVIGRMLDRLVPKLIAREVNIALTEQGDDRLESVTQTLQDITTYHKEQLHSFKSQPDLMVAEKDMQTAAAHLVSQDGTALPTSWDLAYISLAETPQEIERDAEHYRFVPDRKSPLSKPSALVPGLQEHMAELQTVQQALQRERFYRAIIRYWRVFHVCLTLLTIGLTLWHLEFAATLMFPTYFH